MSFVKSSSPFGLFVASRSSGYQALKSHDSKAFAEPGALHGLLAYASAESITTRLNTD